MKKQIFKIAIIALVVLMLVPTVLSACRKKAQEIKIYALSGTTALGMAQMIQL